PRTARELECSPSYPLLANSPRAPPAEGSPARSPRARFPAPERPRENCACPSLLERRGTGGLGRDHRTHSPRLLPAPCNTALRPLSVCPRAKLRSASV